MQEVYKQSFKHTSSEHVELSVLSCGLEKCNASHIWGPGIRDHYLIHLVLSGKGVYRSNEQEFELSAGDLFLVSRRTLNSYIADSQDPWEYAWVGFNGAIANKLVLQLPFSKSKPIHHTQNVTQLENILQEMYSSHGFSPKEDTAMIGHLYLFLSKLMHETMHTETQNKNTSTQYVLDAIKFIQGNYSHCISIDDVAKSIGVSRSHLYRVFMANIGKSPIDYLTEYRINEACNLLQSGNLSIAEVAISVGFFDQFYFSRVFKKLLGMPPSKYLFSLNQTSTESDT